MFINIRLPFGLIVQIYRFNLKSERKSLERITSQTQAKVPEGKWNPRRIGS